MMSKKRENQKINDFYSSLKDFRISKYLHRSTQDFLEGVWDELELLVTRRSVYRHAARSFVTGCHRHRYTMIRIDRYHDSTWLSNIPTYLQIMRWLVYLYGQPNCIKLQFTLQQNKYGSHRSVTNIGISHALMIIRITQLFHFNIRTLCSSNIPGYDNHKHQHIVQRHLHPVAAVYGYICP